MTKSGVYGLAIILTAPLAGRSQDPYSTLDAPRKFFEKNKVGSSPDYGIIKFGNVEDHVVTVHGFADDLDSCQQIANALNRDACAEITDGSACLDPYSCRPLNH